MRSLWILLLVLPPLCCAQQTPAQTPTQTPTQSPTESPIQSPITTATPVTTSTLTGSVTDVTGARVPGAALVLSTEGTSTQRQTTADSDGDFDFAGVLPGAFHLAVTATGLQPGAAAGTLLPGQSLELPPIALRIAMQDTEVDVTFTRQELGVAEVQAEEHQRILGIIPNFSISYDWYAPPMTTRQKYTVALRETIDPVSIVLNAGLAGYQQAEEELPGYHEGTVGYFKRFGADMATGAIGSFIAGAVLPQVFHQDPRYFWKGSGTVRQRVLYSVSTVFICRNDRNGRWMPNYSNVLGNFTAGAISNVYYPASSREGAALTFENGAIALGFGAVGNLFQEFVLHRFTPKLPRSTPAPLGAPQP